MNFLVKVKTKKCWCEVVSPQLIPIGPIRYQIQMLCGIGIIRLPPNDPEYKSYLYTSLKTSLHILSSSRNHSLLVHLSRVFLICVSKLVILGDSYFCSTLAECFSCFNIYQNPLKGLLKCRLQSPPSKLWIQWFQGLGEGQRIHRANWFPHDMVFVGPWTHFE